MKKRNLSLLLVLCAILLIPNIHLNSVSINIPWDAVYAQYRSILFIGGISWGKGVVVDGNDYIYTTGSSLQWNTMNYGSPLIPFNISSSDAFVSKWDKKGNLIWYTFLGSDMSDYGEGISSDSEGNIYVTGSSWSEWDVGIYGTPRSPHNNPGTSNDGFVAKLSPNGELLWYTFLGGVNNDTLVALDVSKNGDVFVTGSSYNIWKTGVYGNPLIEYNPGSFFSSDIVVAKLNNSGLIQWYTFLGSEEYEYPASINVTSGGSVFVSGQAFLYWPNGKYGIPLAEKMVDDQPDGFLAKLSSNGSFQWYRFIGENKSVFPMSIDSSKDGRVFMTGIISERPHIDAVSFSSEASKIYLQKANNEVILFYDQTCVASFGQNGEKNWLKSFEFAENSSGTSIDVGPLGDLFVIGDAFEGMPLIPVSDTLIEETEFNAYSYLMNVSQSGKKKWIYRFDDYGFGSGFCVDAVKNGITYITGNNLGIRLISSSKNSPKIGIEIPGFDSWVYLVKVNHIYNVNVRIKTTGGIAEKEMYEVIPGDDAVVDLIPDPGYEVDKIVDNGNKVESADPYVLTLVNSDHDLDVYFRLIKYPPELILTGDRVEDTAWIIKKEFGDLSITIIEHETSPMEVKAYVLYKYINGEWKELTRFAEPGVYSYQDKYLIKDSEANYILKALAPDGSVVAETDILIL